MSLVDFSELIVKKLVKEPDLVKVQEFDSEDNKTIDKVVVREEQKEDSKLMLHLSVDSSDMGRIIGKGGKIATSVKTLIQAKAYNDGIKRVRVNIDSF